MTTQAALNGYTQSEPFCVHLSKVNKLPYNGTTLVAPDKISGSVLFLDFFVVEKT